jgi:diguanylate cyclase (GGDEF)-like protein
MPLSKKSSLQPASGNHLTIAFFLKQTFHLECFSKLLEYGLMTSGERKTLPAILIIEDDPLALAALERLLRRDFQVHCAAETEAALLLLRRHGEIAVILSDYRLPKVSGLEFLSRIKDEFPHTIRIILTGQVSSEELTRAMEQNILHRFFLKPWDNDILLLQMHEAFKQHQMLIEAASDPVTGLANMRALQADLTREIERCKRHKRLLSLIMIDVDSFKKFNDTKGHPEGNTLLKKIAGIIKENIRNIDTAYRYAGDEFALLLPDTDNQRAFEIAERLRKKCENLPNGSTISLGVAHLAENCQSPEALTEKADQALYLAKRKGKNQTVVAVP